MKVKVKVLDDSAVPTRWGEETDYGNVLISEDSGCLILELEYSERLIKLDFDDIDAAVELLKIRKSKEAE